MGIIPNQMRGNSPTSILIFVWLLGSCSLAPIVKVDEKGRKSIAFPLEADFSPDVMDAGDFDGDGLPDFVFLESDLETANLVTWIGDEPAWKLHKQNAFPDSSMIKAGDFLQDGNKQDELAVWEDQDGGVLRIFSWQEQSGWIEQQSTKLAYRQAADLVSFSAEDRASSPFFVGKGGGEIFGISLGQKGSIHLGNPIVSAPGRSL